MPELLRVQTPKFEFSVWANVISTQQSVYQTTLAKRNIHTQHEHDSIEASTEAKEFRAHLPVIRLSPPQVITQVTIGDENSARSIMLLTQEPIAELSLNTHVFFENTQYQFEWVFYEPVENARLTHRSQIVNDGFRFVPKREALPARLTGTINTGNDVGWMRLPLNCEKDGISTQHNIAFEVLPTKMVLHQDLPAMYQAIDHIFPLWRFSLVEKTEQDAAQGSQRGHFPLMWLANFGQLRERLQRGLKVISQAPHSRLQPHVAYTKAVRLKGYIAYKLGAQIQEDFGNGQYYKHYRVENKRLSVDTPENRFIKMVVTHSKKQLANFEQRLRANNQAPDRQRLSDAFLRELHIWQKPLQKTLGQNFFKEVGDFSGLNRESLVLQQKSGYSTVYRVWQELKFYLDLFANQSSISMKSVAEIYEIWCFLCLKNILQDELGFEPIASSKANLTLNEFFEYQLKDGLAGAFEFRRADGIKARLAHEPKFTRRGKSIRSYLVNQEPDIVLELALPPTKTGQAPKRFIWIFDAKYRIKSDSSRFDDRDVSAIDYVPDDAINQMHRYRDALICLTEGSDEHSQDTASANVQKSRPVFGAFALYPGYFDQENEINPYAEAIGGIGIGAFALLPSANNGKGGHTWLLNFLKEQVDGGPDQDTYYALDRMAERFYVQEAARIPYYGMQQVLYPDLTMTVALGGQRGRANEYFIGFEQGTARWYHLPQKTFLAKFKQHIANEIRYLALASTSEQNSSTKQIDKIWPVRKVVLLPRYAILEQQAGKASHSEELYYLFELGRPLSLQTSVSKVPHRPIKNSMKLTTLTKLESVYVFNDIEWVYQDALA